MCTCLSVCVSVGVYKIKYYRTVLIISNIILRIFLEIEKELNNMDSFYYNTSVAKLLRNLRKLLIEKLDFLSLGWGTQKESKVAVRVWSWDSTPAQETLAGTL